MGRTLQCHFYLCRRQTGKGVQQQGRRTGHMRGGHRGAAPVIVEPKLRLDMSGHGSDHPEPGRGYIECNPAVSSRTPGAEPHDLIPGLRCRHGYHLVGNCRPYNRGFTWCRISGSRHHDMPGSHGIGTCPTDWHSAGSVPLMGPEAHVEDMCPLIHGPLYGRQNP